MKKQKENLLNKSPTLESSDNPYLDNQRGYLERLNAERANTTTWKHIAWFSNIITLFAVSGAIYLGTLPNIVPFIFKQDGTGGITALGLANQKMEVNRQMIAAEVQKFVIATQQVPASKDLRTENVKLVTNMTTSNGFSNVFAPMLREKYKDVGDGELIVTVTNILPIQKNSWLVDWTETLNGKPMGSYQGNLTIDRLPNDYKQSTEQMLYNPLHLVITDFTFNKNAGVKNNDND